MKTTRTVSTMLGGGFEVSLEGGTLTVKHANGANFVVDATEKAPPCPEVDGCYWVGDVWEHVSACPSFKLKFVEQTAIDAAAKIDASNKFGVGVLLRAGTLHIRPHAADLYPDDALNLAAWLVMRASTRDVSARAIFNALLNRIEGVQ